MSELKEALDLCGFKVGQFRLKRLQIIVCSAKKSADYLSQVVCPYIPAAIT